MVVKVAFILTKKMKASLDQEHVCVFFGKFGKPGFYCLGQSTELQQFETGPGMTFD